MNTTTELNEAVAVAACPKCSLVDAWRAIEEVMATFAIGRDGEYKDLLSIDESGSGYGYALYRCGNCGFETENDPTVFETDQLDPDGEDAMWERGKDQDNADNAAADELSAALRRVR